MYRYLSIIELPLGANCSGEEMCLDDRSCCNPVRGVCECVGGTYDSNGDMSGGECQDRKRMFTYKHALTNGYLVYLRDEL